MTLPQVNCNNQNRWRHILRVKRKQLEDIKAERICRTSLLLQAMKQFHKTALPQCDRVKEVQTAPSPPNSRPLHKLSNLSRKRNRDQQERETTYPSSPDQKQPPSKRPKSAPSSCTTKKLHLIPTTTTTEAKTDPVLSWIQTGKWQKEYFEQDNETREDFDAGKLSEEGRQRVQLLRMHGLSRFREVLARKRSASRRGGSALSISETTSDQSREKKSYQYTSEAYQIRLEQKGSYMHDHTLGITVISRDSCKMLLDNKQSVPQDTLFRDDLFDETCESVRGRNEAMIVRDITPLICPSAQVLRIRGGRHLSSLFETVNEAWKSMAQYEGSLPQPDYSVGFGRRAFTREQLDKLGPFVGMPGSTTYLMATMRMYFPYLTCEVKRGASSLDIADRQNAQSMSMALRALVVLFRLVKRESELDREILTFSISHDDKAVQIYGHYPVIEGDETNFYRHKINDFNFTARDGKDKWTAYTFVKNVYDYHSPKLHKMICSAIDDLSADFSRGSSQSASALGVTLHSSQQSTDPTNRNVPGDGNSPHSSFLASQEVTPATSFVQTDEPAFKKQRK